MTALGSLRQTICVVLIALSLLIPQAAWSNDAPRYLELTILHTNDLHGHLFPYDYDNPGSEGVQVGGVARTAALIRQIKEQAGHPVLVMEAGDVFQRGPLADLCGKPEFAALNMVPYDIMTLGNNEFKGAPGIEAQQIMFDRIKQARFPVVCANVYHASTGKIIVPAYHIFEINGVRIGVFGLTAPRVASYPQAKGLEIRDCIASAKQAVSELKEKADFIIGLTHVGYPLDLELAAAVPEIDVIIGGDSHTFLFEPTFVKHASSSGLTVNGAPVCQAGEWGRYLGRLDLKLRKSDSGEYDVVSYSGKLISIDSSINPAEDVQMVIDTYARPYMRKVGYLDAAVSKSQAPAWVAERMREAAGAQVGIQPVDNVENGLGKGDITYLDVRSMFSFVNPIVKLTVTGEQIKQFIMQRQAGLAGIKQVDGELYFGSDKLDNNAAYTLAVESFYAQDSPALSSAQSSEQTGLTTLDSTIKYLEAQKRPE